MLLVRWWVLSRLTDQPRSLGNDWLVALAGLALVLSGLATMDCLGAVLEEHDRCDRARAAFEEQERLRKRRRGGG